MPSSAVEYVIESFVLRADWDPGIRDTIYQKVKDDLNAFIAEEAEEIRSEIDETVARKAFAYESEYANRSNEIRQRLLNTEIDYWRSRGFPEYPEMNVLYQPDQKSLWQHPYPLLPHFTDAMVKDFEAELLKIFDSAFPQPDAAKLRSELAKSHPLYRKGDKVTFKIRGGLAKNNADTVEGYVRNINKLKVFVGMKGYLRENLDPETQAMFYKDANEKLINDKIRTVMRSYRNARAFFVTRWIPYLFRDHMYNKGYVPQYYLGRQSENDDATKIFWISRGDFIEKIYQEKKEEKDKLYKSRYQLACKAYFTEAAKRGLYREDFEYFPQCHDYLPVSVASSLRSQLAAAKAEKIRLQREHQEALAEERRKAEEAKAEQLRLIAEAEERRFSELYGQESNIEDFIRDVLRTMVLGKIDTMQWENSSMAIRYPGINDYKILAIEITGKEATCTATITSILQNGTNRDTNIIFTIVNKDNCFKIRRLEADEPAQRHLF